MIIIKASIATQKRPIRFVDFWSGVEVYKKCDFFQLEILVSSDRTRAFWRWQEWCCPPPLSCSCETWVQNWRPLEVAKFFATVAKSFGVMLPFLATGAKQVWLTTSSGSKGPKVANLATPRKQIRAGHFAVATKFATSRFGNRCEKRATSLQPKLI